MALLAQFSAFGISPWIICGAVFLAIAAVVWLIAGYFLGDRSRAEERLEDFRDPNARKRRDQEGGMSVAKLLESAAPALAKPFVPKTEQEQSKLKLELSYAGFRSPGAPSIYMVLRVLG